jgi:serine/threonine protein kinase
MGNLASLASAPSRRRRERQEEEESGGGGDHDEDEPPGPLGDEYRTLAAFDVLDTLGTGTLGRVRLARHKASKQFFAIKAMRKADVVRLRQVAHVASERALLAAGLCTR